MQCLKNYPRESISAKRHYIEGLAAFIPDISGIGGTLGIAGKGGIAGKAGIEGIAGIRGTEGTAVGAWGTEGIAGIGIGGIIVPPITGRTGTAENSKYD